MRFTGVLTALLISAIGALTCAGTPASADSAPTAAIESGTTTEGVVFGDLDCDVDVDTDDALLGLEVLASPVDTTAGGVCESNGDLNCDAQFTAVDILLIFRAAAEVPLDFDGCPAIGDAIFDISPQCENLPEPLAIPDNGDATLTFEFPESEEILGLAICLNVEHSLIGDLVITLKHDDTASVVTLTDRIGSPPNSGNCTGHDRGLAVLFADSGDETLQEHCTNAATSEFVDLIVQPDEPLDAFTGEDVNGTWTLTVSDASTGHTGTITGSLFTYIFQP